MVENDSLDDSIIICADNLVGVSVEMEDESPKFLEFGVNPFDSVLIEKTLVIKVKLMPDEVGKYYKIIRKGNKNE